MSPGAATVLVFSQYCPRSIGEQIVVLPFLHVLRRRTGARVVLVAPEDSSHLLAAMGAADEVVEYPLRAGPGGLLRIARDLRRRGAATGFQLRKRSLRTSVLACVSTPGPLVGYRGDLTFLFQRVSIPFDTSIYLASLYLRLLDADLDEYSRDLPREDDGYALIVPLGLTEAKQWPIPSWLEVARGLAEDRPVRFLVGPGMEEVRAEVAVAGFPVHVAPDFPAMERLVTRASVVLGNDCGPAHFAQIRDIPRVTLFERSINWRHWHRPGPRSRVLRGPSPGAISAITPADVLAAARELLGETARPR